MTTEDRKQIASALKDIIDNANEAQIALVSGDFDEVQEKVDLIESTTHEIQELLRESDDE